jgi:acyl-CoA hydrolase
MQIGKYCSELIEDGTTLQMGIGSIPNAVLECLTNHKDLGVHTEMFSDGIIPLVESGVINNNEISACPEAINSLIAFTCHDLNLVPLHIIPHLST